MQLVHLLALSELSDFTQKQAHCLKPINQYSRAADFPLWKQCWNYCCRNTWLAHKVPRKMEKQCLPRIHTLFPSNAIVNTSTSIPCQHLRHGHINYSLITATASIVCSIVHCCTICSVVCVLPCVLLNMLDICVLLYVLIVVCAAQYAWFARYFLCCSILICRTGLYTHNLCCAEVGEILAQWCCLTWKIDS